ncbi:MAG: DUF4157 domain-containing protein [Proteobacteria bacterium]|nr:DUF4157 domain-containing protein [Pseudomonadota bacterium]
MKEQATARQKQAKAEPEQEPEQELGGWGNNALAELVANPGNPGASDGPVDPKVRSQAERSLGIDLSGIRTRIGTGRAEQSGAAAMTQGSEIHLADAAVGSDGSVLDDNLMFHEMAHAAHQSGGLASTGINMEAEADAAALAMAQGQSFNIEGSTGGAAIPQAKGFTEWWNETTDAVRKASSSGLEIIGFSDEEVLDENGDVVPVDGTSVSSSTNIQGTAINDEMSTTTRNTAEDGTVTEQSSSSNSIFNFLSGLFSTSEKTSSSTQTVDSAGHSVAVTAQLEGKRDGLDEQISEVQDAEAKLDKDKSDLDRAEMLLLSKFETEEEARASDEFALIEAKRAGVAEQEAQLANDRKRLMAERDQVRADLGSVTEENAEEMAQKHGMTLDPTMSTQSSATTNSTETDLNILDGNVGHKETQTNSEVDGDSSSTTQSSSETQVQVGGGIQTSTTESLSNTTNSGGQESKSSASEETRSGLVVADGQIGSTSGTTLRVGQDGTEVEASTDTTVTNTTASKEGSLGVSHEGDTLKGGVKVSNDGSFSVDVEEVANSNPPQFNLVVKVHYGGAIGGELGTTGEDKSLSAEVGAKAGATMTFTHLMEKEEADQYMSMMDQAAAGILIPNGPEFELIYNTVTAAKDNAGSVDEALGAIVGNGESAKDLSVGDTIELTLEGSVEGKVGGEANGMGLSVSGSASETRTISITNVNQEMECDGDGTGYSQKMVQVTVTFADTRSAGVDGSVSSGAVSGSGGYSASSGSGQSATFLLDPEAEDYDTKYSRICGCLTTAELTTLQGELATDLWGRSESSSEGTETKAGLEVGKAAVDIGTSSQLDEEVTWDETGEANINITGGQTDQASLKLGGVTVGSSSETNQATAQLDDEGELEIDFSTEKTETGLDASGDTPGLMDVIKDGPTAALEQLLTETYTTLSGYECDAGTVNTMVGRAANTEMWSLCAEFVFEAYTDWVALGRELVSPVVEERFLDQGDRGKELAQAQAVARFMSSTGNGGMTCVSNMLRHWGEGFGTDSGEQDDLGLMYEWPSSIGEQKAIFDDLAAKVPQLIGMDAESYTTESVIELRDTAWTLYMTVNECADFDEPQAKMEMLDAISKLHTDLELRVAGVNESGSLEEAEVEVTRLEILLISFPNEELRLFQQAESYMSERQDGFFSSLAATVKSQFSSGLEPMKTFDQIVMLYEFWKSQVLELRTAYETAGQPQEEWRVSSGPGEARKEYEPNAAHTVELWASRQNWNLDTLEERKLEMLKEYGDF